MMTDIISTATTAVRSQRNEGFHRFLTRKGEGSSKAMEAQAAAPLFDEPKIDLKIASMIVDEEDTAVRALLRQKI
jgi:hypothetical protein